MKGSTRLVLTLAGLSLTVFFVTRAVGQIGSPWDLGYPERALVYKILAVSQGQALYTDWNKEPYAIAPYTPIYYLAAGWLAAALRLGLPAIYILSRGLSLAATLMSSGVIYILSRRLGVSKYVSWMGSGIFLSSPLLLPWGYTSRPDALALLFSLMAMMMIVRGGRFSFWLSALFAVLAFYTKQVYVSAITAIVVYWLVNKEYKRATELAATVTLAVLIVFSLGNSITGGEFYRNVVLANKVHFDFSNILWVLAYVLTYNFYTVGLASLSFRIEFRKDGIRTLVRIYFGLSAVVAILLSFKPGTDVNYYLEPMAVGTLLAGVSLDWLIRRGEKTGLGWLVGTGYVLMVMDAALVRSDRLELWRGGMLNLAAISGPVLTQDPGLALRTGHELVISDAFNFSFLADQRLWDPAKLVGMIDEKKYEGIGLLSDVNNLEKYGGVTTWPKSLVDPIVNNYELVYYGGRNFVYLPK